MDEVGDKANPSSSVEGAKFPQELEQAYLGERSRIQNLYRKVWVWHGSGRLRQENGEVVDNLTAILDTGALNPYHDVWNGSREVDSVSATVSRPYAVVYSDIHIREGSSDLLYKDKRKLHLLRQTISHLPSLLRHSRRLLRQKSEAREWMGKHTGQEIDQNVWGTATKFGKLRSITPGDYPILFAIKHGAFEPMSTAGYIRATEVRTDKPIPLTQINHIEVPLKYVDETQELLHSRGVDIPVVVRELGEKYQSEFNDKDVVSGKGFARS